jgi:hypothetical protein
MAMGVILSFWTRTERALVVPSLIAEGLNGAAFGESKR